MRRLPRNKKLPKKNRHNNALPPRSHNQPNGTYPFGPHFESQPLPPKHNNNGGMPPYFGALGGYQGVSTQYANQLVNGIIRQEVHDLRQQKRDAKRDYLHQGAQVRADYKRGVGDLNYVHGETADVLKSLGQQTANTYSGEMDQQKAATAMLQQQLGGIYSGASSGAQAELARLGISGAGNLDQLNADATNAGNVASLMGQNTQSNMGMAAGNAQALNGLLQGMNQGSQMSGLGSVLNARNDALSENRQNRHDDLTAISEAMQEARGSRRDLLMQMLQQLQQTGWSQYMDEQGLKMQRRQMRHNRKH